MADLADQVERLDARRRALLERLLADEEGAGAIPRRPGADDPVPLSPGQERLWFLDQLAGGNPAYNMPAAFRLTGALAPAALRAALQAVTRRHEALRTTFTLAEGEPRQRIAPQLAVALPIADLAGLPRGPRERASAELAAREAAAPFHLARGPLVRAFLLRLAPAEHLLLLTVHHAVADGWSMGLLFDELAALYTAGTGGAPAALPALPIQYADFALWQRRQQLGRRHRELAAYWKRRLAGAPAVLDLPADRPRPAVQGYRGATLAVAFPAGLAARLRAVGRRVRATPFITLLAAFAALLGRWTGSEDVVLGTPVAGRDRQELEPLIGLFLSTLALRVDLAGDPTFDQLLVRVREATLDDFAHAEIPFAAVLAELGVERSLSHPPLFQSMLVLQNTPDKPLRLTGLSVEPLAVRGTTAKLDLQVVLVETGGAELRGWLEHSADLFEARTVERLAGHLRVFLSAIAEDPGRPVAELPVLSAAERGELLRWNETARPYRLDRCVHQWIKARAAAAPDAVAVACGAQELTYGELDRRADRLAHRLAELGVGLEGRVAVCAERSAELVVALLGILKAGAAYVPLDPDYPRERLAYMLADSRASVLLTDEGLRGRLPFAPVLCLQPAGDEPPGSSAAPPGPFASPEQAAYVIYTSGSTGRPKGVAVSHRGLCNRLLWMQEAYGLTPGDRVLQKTPLSFDVSVWELFWPLMVGARLVMARPGGHRDPAYLVDVIAAQEITTLHFVPSMLGAFLEQPDLARCHTLRRVIASGEALPKALVERFFANLGAELHNLYGPTEASIDVTAWACARDDRGLSVPIGRPIANLQLHVLDRRFAPLPVGVAGELCIGGVGLARGYEGRPELTAERFVPDPFSAAGGRLYRTGDLGRWRADGALDYLGRLDHQVKVRGFRIELGEIEAALGRQKGIREAVAAAPRAANGEAFLAAYLVADEADRQAADELRASLREELPEHMIPAVFVWLAALPLSPNGKVDRKALPAPGLARPALATGYAPPRTHAEQVLAAVWSRVLAVAPIGIHDDYFALGGDSIRSIRLVALARERGLEITLQQVFQHPTVRELAPLAAVAGEAGPERWSEPFELVSEHDRSRLPTGLEDAYPLTRLQTGMLFHGELAAGTAVYHDVFSLRLRAAFSAPLLRQALAALAASHPVLRSSFELARFGEPLQLVHAAAAIPLVMVDLSALGAPAREAALAAWIAEEKRRPFTLASAPLLRYAAHLEGAGEFHLTLGFHHAILDGWSVASLTTELLHRYAALLGGAAPLPARPPRATFRDYVALELASLRSPADESYWRERLRGSGRTVLPRWPRSRPAPARRRVVSHEVAIPEETSRLLAGLARQLAVPIKSVLFAAHLRVLGLLSGQAEVLTGMVTTGRPEREDGERALGLFLNVLPAGAVLAGGSWLELVQAAFAAERDALPHRRYPVASLYRSLQGASAEALFETSFNFVHFHVYEGVRSLPGVEIAASRFDEETNFPLVANFSLGVDKGSGARLSLAYDPGELAPLQAARIGSCYARCLAAMARSPAARYEEAALLGEEETALLAGWNATARPYPLAAPLHAWIEEQAARTPRALAVVCANEALTYGELEERANQLARHLRGLGVTTESRVAVCAERSLEMVVGLLGVLKAGGAYVPLDPSYPAERLAYMLEDSRAAALLTQGERAAALLAGATPVVRLDRDWAVVGRRDAGRPRPGVAPDNLAYVIYTSGSTGRPKGAMVPHRGIVNRLLWMQEAYPLDAGDRVLQKTPFSFDVSVWELFWPLMVGARLVMARPEGHRDPAYLAELIEREGVTTLHFVPSLLRAFLAAAPAERCGSLRRVIASGEALSPALVAELLRRLPGVELHNLYGPTEASVDVTAWACGGEPELVPIGKPIANLRIHVLDRQLLPAPICSPGELHIAGVGLGRGYLGRPELTAERFVPDPAGQAGDRVYKSGDLARWLPDGNLDYLGRLDHQVKVRGFRIELGEIETALERHPRCAAAVVVTRRAGEEQRLVAYLVARDGGALAVEELRSFLSERLPDHMVPAAFVQLEAFPLSPSGKVDRQALPAPDGARPALEQAYAPPRGALERQLAEIWEQVLQVERVGIDDDFFALGGDSILSIRVAAVARQHGLRLGLQELLAHRTVRALARLAAPAPEESARLLARLDQLSEREVDALLAAMTAGEPPMGAEPPEAPPVPAGREAQPLPEARDAQPVPAGLQAQPLPKGQEARAER